jgi:hypothetical protein
MIEIPTESWRMTFAMPAHRDLAIKTHPLIVLGLDVDRKALSSSPPRSRFLLWIRKPEPSICFKMNSAELGPTRSGVRSQDLI